MMSIRGIQRISNSKPTLEGAGVKLHRAFGFGDSSPFDPFLLFDDFRGDNVDDYIAGFPWHPHRGIETITYILRGGVEHKDSLGNTGVLRSGDLQWMTAGSGIIHQEMPEGNEKGQMHGFQLWANLPSRHKMTSPRYQDFQSSDIPVVQEDDGMEVRVLCGNGFGKTGPVEGIATNPQYLDIYLPPEKTRTIKVEVDRHAFAYVYEGSGYFYEASEPRGVLTEDLATDTLYRAQAVKNRHLILFDRGDEIKVSSETQGLRFLLATGSPLKEPVAWHGPIVMNTQQEINQAMRELQEGSFIK